MAHELGKSNDSVQRSPELMAHIGEKGAFCSVGYFRLMTGAVDFLNKKHDHPPDK